MTLDREAVFQRLKGKRNRLVRLVDIFHQSYRAQLEAIAQALADADPAGLYQSAHSYKGTVATFDAGPATGLALELETRGREGRLDGAEGLYRQLLEESEALSLALQQLLQEDGWA